MVRGCKGDLREFRPTAFAGVPLVYDKIKAGIMKKVDAESPLKKLIFKYALNAIVFNQFKDRLGGRVRLMVCGGAPLSPSAHLFLAACFGTPVLQGYGLTETCGAGSVMMLDDNTQGTVGPPVPCVGEAQIRHTPRTL
jgi:long-chain acyl-CoA synthetase